MNENKLDQLHTAIENVIKSFCSIDKNGNCYIEILPNPYDTPNDILHVIAEYHITNLDGLNEVIFELYQESEFYETVYVSEQILKDENVKQLWKDASSEISNIFGVEENDLYDVFGNIESSFMRDYLIEFAPAGFYIKYPDYSNTEVCVDICIDTGDMNYDYVLNDIFPHYDGTIEDIPQKEASLLWLAETQGYSGKELFEYLISDKTSNNKFLKSTYEELLNSTSHMNQVTFLVKMPLEQYFECNSIIDKDNNSFYVPDRVGKGFITVSKETMCGLHDFWSGAGGGMDIELQNDVQIPISCMNNLRYEFDGKTNYSEYGIQDVYGTNDVWWDSGKVLQIDYETPCTYIPKEIEFSEPSLESEAKDMNKAADAKDDQQPNLTKNSKEL